MTVFSLHITGCGFVSVCPCTMLQVATNVDGANSTKPLLGVVRV